MQWLNDYYSRLVFERFWNPTLLAEVVGSLSPSSSDTWDVVVTVALFHMFPKPPCMFILFHTCIYGSENLIF
jgi:hypothetical protein